MPDRQGAGALGQEAWKKNGPLQVSFSLVNPKKFIPPPPIADKKGGPDFTGHLFDQRKVTTSTTSLYYLFL